MEFVLAQTLLCCVLLSLFFFPYKSLCSRSEIIRSPYDLCSSSCSFISSRFDHNFILMYWPKFIGKAETKWNCRNLKNRSRFLEPYGSTTVRTGPCFFSHRAVLEAKKTIELRGSQSFRSDHTVQSEFQNLEHKFSYLWLWDSTQRFWIFF